MLMELSPYQIFLGFSGFIRMATGFWSIFQTASWKHCDAFAWKVSIGIGIWTGPEDSIDA